MGTRAFRAVVFAAFFGAAAAWADGTAPNDDRLFELDCVEWSDAGMAGADGGAEPRCVKYQYQTPYGCSSVGGPLWLGLIALGVRAWRARPRARATSAAPRRP